MSDSVISFSTCSAYKLNFVLPLSFFRYCLHFEKKPIVWYAVSTSLSSSLIGWLERQKFSRRNTSTLRMIKSFITSFCKKREMITYVLPLKFFRTLLQADSFYIFVVCYITSLEYCFEK